MREDALGGVLRTPSLLVQHISPKADWLALLLIK